MRRRRAGRLVTRLAREPVLIGALAGAAAALVFLVPATPMGGFDGLLGSPVDDALLAVHVVIGAATGAAYARLVPLHRRGEHASRITLALMAGLILWVVGPLTIGPALDGDAPTWSVEAASRHFPSLIAHLMFGGGLGVLLALAARAGVGGGAEAPTASRESTQPVRVVIVGGGFAGLGAAQRFEELNRRDVPLDVTLVSRSNFLLFTPMLAEVASSGLDAQAISAPIRVACPHTRFRHADVQAVDADAKCITAIPIGSDRTERIAYDHLIVAVGSVPAFYGLPGLAEHAFTLKTLEDAARLRNHVIAALETAEQQTDGPARQALLTFVVAGGGFAGTESIAELFDLVRSVRRYYPGIGREEPRFVLVHSSDRIIPELSRELGDYARERLERRGIEFVLGRRVAAADAESVTLDDDSRLPTRHSGLDRRQPAQSAAARPALRAQPARPAGRRAHATGAGPGWRVGPGRRGAGARRAPARRLPSAHRAARDPPGQGRGRQRGGRRARTGAQAVQLPRHWLAGGARLSHRRRRSGRPEVLRLRRLGHVAHDLFHQIAGHGPQGAGGAGLGHRPAVPARHRAAARTVGRPGAERGRW